MPLGPDQLQAPYDINGLDNPPPPVKGGPPTKATPYKLSDLDNVSVSPVSIGQARPTDIQEYGKYLDQGVYSDQDIDTERAEHQSVLNKTGHMLGNLPGNIIGSF